MLNINYLFIMFINTDLDKLIENLPFFLRRKLDHHPKKEFLIEIVIDLGRRPEARFVNKNEYLSQKLISWQDLDFTIKRIGNFSNDNRAGIQKTLHRISCIRNRQFVINGLTCRIGRTLFGTINGVRDLLESEKSILILGKPGVGKTTAIREISRILSEEKNKRVVIVDTSNEIAGDSDIPHVGIGKARIMQVAQSKLQHQVMIEAIENHMPEVIIIDEIGTELEALAARTISERGVQLIGTAHGNSLESVIKNPLLTDLTGGIQYVTLSDEEARRRSTQKSVLERKAYPAFQLGIEINNQNNWNIHQNIKESVDLILQNEKPVVQRRYFKRISETEIIRKYETNFEISSLVMSHNFKNWKNFKKEKKIINNFFLNSNKEYKIYSYSLPIYLLQFIFKKFNIKLTFTNQITKGTIIIGLKNHINNNNSLIDTAQNKIIPIFTLKNSTAFEITQLLFHILKLN